MKQRKIPLRKCLITNEQYPKQELLRIVKDKEGLIHIDPSGKLNGRGAYIKLTKENVELAKKRKVFERAFETNDVGDIYLELEQKAND